MVRLQWDGLDAFLRELGAVPDALLEEGMTIIRDETEGAAVEINQRYPRKTGTLAKRVRTSYPSSTILVGIVQSAAPHAHLYEFGTKGVRKYTGTDRLGRRFSDASRGRMPTPTPSITVPIAQRRRVRMRRRMTEMLRRHGFNVGDA